MTVSRQGSNARKSRGRSKASSGASREGAAPRGRVNQRRRTKAAVMEGARKLLLEGQVPSIADAAEEAGVSRATAYRYFPSQGALIREAVDEVLVRPWEWEKRLEGSDGLVERVERYMFETRAIIRDNEALMRGSLLTALEQWARLQAGEDLGEEPIKRGGRLDGIRAAIEPFEGQLDPEARRRLAIGLSVAIGIEARIVMRDIWNLDDEEAEEVTLWMARAFTKAALEEGSARSTGRQAGRSRSRRPRASSRRGTRAR
jgi:AcrR family transcriptional regulator